MYCRKTNLQVAWTVQTKRNRSIEISEAWWSNYPHHPLWTYDKNHGFKTLFFHTNTGPWSQDIAWYIYVMTGFFHPGFIWHRSWNRIAMILGITWKKDIHIKSMIWYLISIYRYRYRYNSRYDLPCVFICVFSSTSSFLDVSRSKKPCIQRSAKGQRRGQLSKHRNHHESCFNYTILYDKRMKRSFQTRTGIVNVSVKRARTLAWIAMRSTEVPMTATWCWRERAHSMGSWYINWVYSTIVIPVYMMRRGPERSQNSVDDPENTYSVLYIRDTHTQRKDKPVPRSTSSRDI